MMINCDPEGQIIPILTQIIDYFSYSPLKTTFLYLIKRLPEVPEYAEMRHNMMRHFIITMISLVPYG